MKRKTIAALVEDAATILQRIVRMKAADQDGYASCVTCGVRKHWKELHGGHFIPRTYTAHKLLEENIHPQCPRCNTFMQGEGSAYTLHMIDTYGEDFVRHLEGTKREVRKYTRPEIMEIIADLKTYEKRIREERGL